MQGQAQCPVGGQSLTCFVLPCLPALQRQREAPGQLGQIRPKAGAIPLGYTGERASPWSVLGVLGPHPPGSAACALCSQRSESVRCASPSRTEFLVAPVDVASKRHLFEKELVGQSREGPASSRKVSGSGPPGVCRPLSLGSAGQLHAFLHPSGGLEGPAMPVTEPPAQLYTQLWGRVPWPELCRCGEGGPLEMPAQPQGRSSLLRRTCSSRGW